MNIDLNSYLDSWATYRIDCELRVKGRAKLNAYGWKKLRKYHLESYLSCMEVPFGFMLVLKLKYPRIYKQIPSANEVYRVCLQKRTELFDGRKYGQR